MEKTLVSFLPKKKKKKGYSIQFALFFLLPRMLPIPPLRNTSIIQEGKEFLRFIKDEPATTRHSPINGTSIRSLELGETKVVPVC